LPAGFFFFFLLLLSLSPSLSPSRRPPIAHAAADEDPPRPAGPLYC
jgi:hypothetical protein